MALAQHGFTRSQQLPDGADLTCCAILCLSAEFFEDLFGHFEYRLVPELPADARFLGAWYDPLRNSFWLKYWSASFRPVSPGLEYPWLETVVVRTTDLRHAQLRCHVCSAPSGENALCDVHLQEAVLRIMQRSR